MATKKLDEQQVTPQRGALVPFQPIGTHPLVPIILPFDANKVAEQTDLISVLPLVDRIMEDAAGDIEISQQNVLSTEGKTVFQATRTVRISKPARWVGPWVVALVLGALAIIGLVITFVLGH